MADLKIKPQAGSGNKLILQDQQAVAVLTTADSGATIANSTLNSPTLVTPALGTVASGNLSNSAIVYPTGHILGVQNAVMQGTQSISTSLVDVTDGTTALSVTSSNTNATKFYIVAMVYCGTDNDVGTHFELWSKIDGASYAKLDAAHSNYGGGGSSHKDFMFAAAGDNDTWNRYTGTHCTSSYLWTPGSFSTSVSVKIRADGYSGTTYIGRNYNHNNSSDWAHSVPSTLTIWEIK